MIGRSLWTTQPRMGEQPWAVMRDLLGRGMGCILVYCASYMAVGRILTRSEFLNGSFLERDAALVGRIRREGGIKTLDFYRFVDHGKRCITTRSNRTNVVRERREDYFARRR